MPLSTEPDSPNLAFPVVGSSGSCSPQASSRSPPLLRSLADPLIHDQIPYFIYVASVVVATWFCGVDAGIFSTVLAAFVGNYFFVLPGTS